MVCDHCGFEHGDTYWRCAHERDKPVSNCTGEIRTPSFTSVTYVPLTEVERLRGVLERIRDVTRDEDDAVEAATVACDLARFALSPPDEEERDGD